MDKEKLRPAILIISDTAAQEPSTDKAGTTLSDAFSTDGGDRWTKPETQIVPDNILAIQRAITHWCDGEGHVNLIVTTGGTGFAAKDYTPEAVSPLIHRHAPGLVYVILHVFQVIGCLSA